MDIAWILRINLHIKSWPWLRKATRIFVIDVSGTYQRAKYASLQESRCCRRSHSRTRSSPLDASAIGKSKKRAKSALVELAYTCDPIYASRRPCVATIAWPSSQTTIQDGRNFFMLNSKGDAITSISLRFCSECGHAQQAMGTDV